MQINKAEALDLCKTCAGNMQKGCVLLDIEGSRDETVEVPPCMSELLTLTNSSSVAKEPLSEGSEGTGKVAKAGADHPPAPSDAIKKVAIKPKSIEQKGSQLSKVRETNQQAETKKVAYDKKWLPNSTEKGSLSGKIPEGNLPKATKSEMDILRLLSEGIITMKRLQLRRKTGIKVIQKHLRNLREKGYINKSNQIVATFDNTWLPSAKPDPGQQHAEGGAVHRKQIRLHAQEFNIQILWKDDRYRERIGKLIFDDGNTIKCHREKIEVYSGQSFFADDVQKATAKSIEYWDRYFVRLENDLKIILVKPRAQNIKLVKQEYAEVGNELAINCEMTGDKIRVYAKEDGKLWFTIDDSFNLREAETQHPETAEEDMRDSVVPFFNDVRDKRPPLPSEVWKYLAETTKHVNEIGAGLNVLVNGRIPTHEAPAQPEKKPEDKWSRMIYG